MTPLCYTQPVLATVMLRRRGCAFVDDFGIIERCVGSTAYAAYGLTPTAAMGYWPVHHAAGVPYAVSPRYCVQFRPPSWCAGMGSRTHLGGGR